MDNMISFPKDCFCKAVKSDYQNYQTSLVRELLQNSIDAGAKNVWFEFSDDSYKCIDDGKGMTLDELKTGFLSYKGSVKKSGNIGGFGEAKNLIILAMDNYSISTKNILVTGEMLQYKISEQIYSPYTIISAKFLPEFQYSKNSYILQIKEYLKFCNLNCNVFINGEKIETSFTAPEGITYEWGKILSQKKKTNQSDWVYIRVNGLLMFKYYMSEINRNVIIEIAKVSTDIFTSNRDGFSWKFEKEIRSIFEKMTIDKTSFFNNISNSNKNIFFGKYQSISIFKQFVKENNLNVEIDKYSDFVNENDYKNIYAQVKNASIDNIVNFDEFRDVSSLESDLYIDIEESSPIKKFDVDSITPKLEKILKYWKYILTEILKNEYESVRFNIGFVFSENTIAKFESKDGRKIFYINPYKISTMKNILDELVIHAIHEVTHLYETYHDERFSSKNNAFLVKYIPLFLTKRKFHHDNAQNEIIKFKI